MGVSRYSKNPLVRQRQEAFDRLQWRCGVDYYAPTIGELRDSGVVKAAQFVCGSYECMHSGESFKLTRYVRDLSVRDLKARHYCGRCKSKKMELRLEFQE